MVNNFTNINKATSPLNSLNIKKTKIYDVGNPGLGLRKAQKFGRVKLVNGIPNPPYHDN
jgi:hypothetical protein